MNSRTCPTCMQLLTVETLKVPRNIANVLSELKIRCEFFHRGCKEFIELGDLEKHMADCGFAPAVCSNNGCNLVVNKQDLEHHEKYACNPRRVKCDSCNDVQEAMTGVYFDLAIIDRELKESEMNINRVQETIFSRVKQLVPGQLNKQEVNNRQLEADVVEMKKCLNKITKQLEEGNEKADRIGGEQNIIIAGGDQPTSRSVEMFTLATRTWTRLQPMGESRQGASSFVYNNQLFVMGGLGNNSMEKISLDEIQVDHATALWKIVPAELPSSLYGHRSIVFHGRLIVTGGYDRNKKAFSDSIFVISFVPRCTSKLLYTMPQSICLHGAAMFGDKILIVGGIKSFSNNSTLRNVVMYDITTKDYQELAPLPYPVSDMATVKWQDDNVIIIGGVNNNNKTLNKALIYNINTQKCQMLPNMKYERTGCNAAVVGDTVVVMGGEDDRGNYLRSIECFRFDSYSWQELPPMQVARWRATATVFEPSENYKMIRM